MPCLMAAGISSREKSRALRLSARSFWSASLRGRVWGYEDEGYNPYTLQLGEAAETASSEDEAYTLETSAVLW